MTFISERSSRTSRSPAKKAKQAPGSWAIRNSNWRGPAGIGRSPASMTKRHEIKASRSLFAERNCPKLADLGVEAEVGGIRRGSALGPDGRMLRIVERVIDVGDVGIYLVQVAASTSEMDSQIARFRLSLLVAFALLAIALALATGFQVAFGLRPLRWLQRELVSIRRGERERI